MTVNRIQTLYKSLIDYNKAMEEEQERIKKEQDKANNKGKAPAKPKSREEILAALEENRKLAREAVNNTTDNTLSSSALLDAQDELMDILDGG